MLCKSSGETESSVQRKNVAEAVMTARAGKLCRVPGKGKCTCLTKSCLLFGLRSMGGACVW